MSTTATKTQTDLEPQSLDARLLDGPSEPELAPNQVRISASAFRDLVAPVLPLANKNDSLPILRTVLLRGHGAHLTATATDRYRAGICRADVPAADGLRALIPTGALRRMLALFKPSRYDDPTLTLTVEATTLHVASGAMGLDLEVAGASMTFRLQDGEYPRGIEGIVRKALEGPISEGMPALNLEFLADFTAALRDRKTPVFVRVTKNTIGVAVGEHFRAALMQVRPKDDDGRDVTPNLVDETWSTLLADTKVGG